MTEIDHAQGIADFLLAHRISIDEDIDPDTGIHQYHFIIIGESLREIGLVRFDSRRGTLLPIETEELRRRLQLPGFINNVVRPFNRLLLAEKGHFMLSAAFEPIHEALDQIDA